MEHLNLEPIDFSRFDTTGATFRGVSINVATGILNFTKLAINDLEISKNDKIVLSTFNNRWFIAKSNDSQGIKVSNKSSSNTLGIRIGKILIKKICSDYKIEIELRRKRLYFSEDRIPSNGYMWFELSKKEISK